MSLHEAVRARNRTEEEVADKLGSGEKKVVEKASVCNVKVSTNSS